jgi:aspartate/methionine/tyrosine aminotransferase
MFSDYADRLSGQPMFKLLDEIKRLERAGKDIVHFEIGDPDFEPPRKVVNRAIALLAEGGNSHYSPSQGVYELREEIAEFHTKINGLTRSIRPEEVVIAPGCNPLIYCLLQCLGQDRSECILMSRPAFPTYQAVADLLSLDLYPGPHKCTRGVMNYPNNPTGKSCTKEFMESFNADFIISDEIYQLITYDERPALSILSVDPHLKKSCMISGYSKAFAMTGWRIGYMIGPQMLCEKISLMLQTIISCTNTFVQKACIGLLRDFPPIEFQKNMEELKARRKIIVEGLNSLPGVECEWPDGAFYVFPSIKETGMTSRQFVDKMLDVGVALLPGTDFGKEGEGFVRLSFCTSQERIKEGIERMNNALKGS